MSVGLAPRAVPEPRVAPSRRPPHLDVRGLGRVVGGTQILHPVWFTARRGEVVAIAGGSGAGKSTLLDLLAGARRGDAGTVFVDGVAAGERTARCGSVPQDDIVHGELSLSRTLEYAAALRLSHPDRDERRRRVQRTLDAVGLGSSADVRVSSLSGGQRKRACIAAELLAEPEVLLLDEPTSGLDPASAAELMAHLRSLAARGTTIVLTTHAPADLDRCDQVLMLAPGGRHVFIGSATMARVRFGVDHLADAYSHLAAAPTLPPPHPEHPYDPTISARDADDESVAVVATTTAPDRPVGWIRQWAASTARTVDLVLRNPLTLAIMLGSPVFVIAMLAALFRPNAVDAGDPSGAIAVVFWVVFSAFFFGLTYGLLQIVAEREIFRRERMAGLRVGAYLAAKVAVLAPFLAVVDLAMLGVLEWSGQLPATSGTDGLALWGVLVAVSSASLAVGLAASALVRTAAQATLALPMLCFPQVLFAGAIVAVSEMAVPGRLLSAALVGRWGFESFGRTLGVGDAHARLPAGFDATFAGSATSGVVILLTITVASVGIAAFALRSR